MAFITDSCPERYQEQSQIPLTIELQSCHVEYKEKREK